MNQENEIQLHPEKHLKAATTDLAPTKYLMEINFQLADCRNLKALIYQGTAKNRYRLDWTGEILLLHVPRGTAVSTVETILHRHRRWIHNRLSKTVPIVQNFEQNHKTEKAMLSPDPIFLDGTPYSLLWEESDQTAIVIGHKNRLLLLKSTQEIKTHFPVIITQWAIRRFLDKTRDILLFWKEVLALCPQRVFIRPTRSQWGSMSRNQNMSLSWHLSGFEEKTLRYIVLHELAHIPFPNHSHRFWEMVRKHMPDCQEAKRDLRNFYPSPSWLDPFNGKRQSLELPEWNGKFR